MVCWFLQLDKIYAFKIGRVIVLKRKLDGGAVFLLCHGGFSRPCRGTIKDFIVSAILKVFDNKTRAVETKDVPNHNYILC